MEPDRVLVDDLDGLDVFHHAAMPVGTDSGVFDAQEVELDGFRIDLTAVVKQHPFAQAEHPGSEVFIGFLEFRSDHQDLHSFPTRRNPTSTPLWNTRRASLA